MLGLQGLDPRHRLFGRLGRHAYEGLALGEAEGRRLVASLGLFKEAFGMAWAAVPGVLQAWYPGIRGGEAIARLLTGAANPSGHLPVTWPIDVSQLPRPTIPGLGFNPADKPEDTIDYDIEGANVGYRWFAAKGLTLA